MDFRTILLAVALSVAAEATLCPDDVFNYGVLKAETEYDWKQTTWVSAACPRPGPEAHGAGR